MQEKRKAVEELQSPAKTPFFDYMKEGNKRNVDHDSSAVMGITALTFIFFNNFFQ